MGVGGICAGDLTIVFKQLKYKRFWSIVNKFAPIARQDSLERGGGGPQKPAKHLISKASVGVN